MKKPLYHLFVAALILALVGATPAVGAPAQAARQNPAAEGAVTWKARTINAPYFSEENPFADKFSEMAVTWFGKVNSTENYADVRVSYNDLGLWVHVSVFDRLVWYDPAHAAANLLKYDGLSLFLNTGAPGATTLNAQTYRFDAQMNWFEDTALYQAANRGKGTTWTVDKNLVFYHTRGYSGGNFNNGKENRGYAIGFIIPFSSLGLDGAPPEGTLWGLGLALRDRDVRPTGAMQPNKLWPETLVGTTPSSWGRINFGFPAYTPASQAAGTVTVRHKLDGQVVTDGGVGGGMNHLCDASAIWTRWGAYTFAGQNSAVVQNQSNLADWPCFAKLYLNFPLAKVPKSKIIVSAKLILHTWGGSDWSQAQPSLIQVSTVRAGWTETGLTWNSAPIPQENVAQTWVNPVDHEIQSGEWPGWRYEWDVSRAVAEAYAAGLPLRVALYEADSAYHSGKYFTTSEAEDWNAEGRPTLEIVWGEK